MGYRIISAGYVAVQVCITVANCASVTERAAVVVMMPCVAATPIPIMRPAVMYVPPSGPITPVPRAVPCEPKITPEPVVYYRTVNEYRLDDIVGSIYVLVTYYLYAYLVLLVFLNVDRGYVLIDIFREDSLQNDQSLVSLTRLYYAQVIYLTVAIQVEVAERAVRIVEHRLELFQILRLSKQFSYNLQVQAFRDVRTVSRNCYCLFRPCRHAHEHQRHQKCS